MQKRPQSEGCTLGSRAIANGYSLRQLPEADAILSSWSDSHMCMMQAERRQGAGTLSLTWTKICRFRALTESAAGCLDFGQQRDDTARLVFISKNAQPVST